MPIFEIEQIKELLSAFDASKATELEIKDTDGAKLVIKQAVASGVVTVAAPVEQAVVAAPTSAKEEKSSEVSAPVVDGKPVASPMVGVFYAAASPDSEPYVTVGSKVHKGDVLCLIEAMKLMNEVTAEQSGEIVSICVENGQVVEYGQPLFLIK